MAKRKKRPDEMTTNEALDHVFPPEVADALREKVAEKPENAAEIPTDDDDSE